MRGNRVAHCLAVEGRQWSTPCCWVEEVPVPVDNLVVEDWADWLRTQSKTLKKSERERVGCFLHHLKSLMVKNVVLVIEEGIANLKLMDEEEEELNGEIPIEAWNYQRCLVGRCLTDSVVHFPSLRNTMADLWHPIGGICISDLGDKRYLFQFFHEIDIQRVRSGTPWFFNNHMLILQTVPVGEDPSSVCLNFTDFWVQIHNLPNGLMTEGMAKQLGDFIGRFMEYDNAIPTMAVRNFIRVQVCLDVILPLKRKKKIRIGMSTVVYARFQYEKLGLFCFVCGKLGHGESFYPLRLRMDTFQITFGWDIFLRAAARRRNNTVSRWLREADGSFCTSPYMERNISQHKMGKESDTGRNSRSDLGERDLIPNSMRLKPSQQLVNIGEDSWRNLGWRELVGHVEDVGPIELVENVENNPLVVSDGKKRQRVVEDFSATLNDTDSGDSLTVIKKLRSVEDDNSILRSIIHNIRSIEDRLESVSYLFVPRESNKVAHNLALEGRRRVGCCSWSDGFPESVRMMALLDRQVWLRNTSNVADGSVLGEGSNESP
ncbi:hypothetical protein J1N35_037861 [Gossypium stocksii]|uniref:DUF4283 domain-containing protein n=1 Tax=Gossypium stocksii TaxID=47602 RepID=A0A9D3UKY8_9ROSI|nr:hypothetical protein J1N35_037861 [Gossypium stocksii]